MKHWIRKFISCILTIAIFMSAMPKQISIKLHMIKICRSKFGGRRGKPNSGQCFSTVTASVGITIDGSVSTSSVGSFVLSRGRTPERSSSEIC
jgi:hypothetical protein